MSQRYDLGVLRLGGIAPPTLPKGAPVTARDGDLARVEARQRYARQLITRQQHAASLSGWAALQAGQPAPEPAYALSQTPTDDYHRPNMAERRVLVAKAAQARAQNLADHPLEATVGQGVVIGNTIVTGSVLSEIPLLRLAGGLRWVGATRAAAVVKNATWASAAEETFGIKASLKQYGSLPWKESAIATRNRFGLDFAGQGIANYYGSKEEDRWARVWDAGISVNLVESVLAGFNVRPLGLGTTSAMFQFSVKSGFRTPLNGSVSWQAFGVQTAAGVGMGYAGIGVGNLLSKRLAYRLYNGAALRLGYDMAYPVWLGSAHLFRTIIPIGLGGATTLGQNKADELWSISPQPRLPIPGSSKP